MLRIELVSDFELSPPFMVHLTGKKIHCVIFLRSKEGLIITSSIQELYLCLKKSF